MSQADQAFTHERLVLAVREALAGCGPVSIGTVDCRLEGLVIHCCLGNGACKELNTETTET